MTGLQFKKNVNINSLFICSALVIIADFILPGRTHVDEVISVKKERQQYYNAARNYHYSYRVFTNSHNFSVSEDFAQTVQAKQKIKYRVSILFKEINSYSLITSETKNIYSLRILSGLAVPFMTILILVLRNIYQRRINGNLVFMIQALLAGDLIFLII